MPVTRCPQGHFYDTDKNSSCPWCGVQNLDKDMTHSISDNVALDTEKTIAVNDHRTSLEDALPNLEEKTIAMNYRNKNSVSTDGATVAIVKKRIGIDPVVGWLVCTKGAEKGRDYRIHTEKNSIGRSDSMDIVIKGDETISRVNHAFLMHNPKKNTFRITNGEGRGLVYVNGDDVSTFAELKAYDVIEMGDTSFAFIPFCNDKFNWTEQKEAINDHED